MKKYKEYRFTVIMSVMIAMLIAVSFYIGYKGNRTTMMIGFVICAFASFIVSLLYNITLEEDCLIIYQWKILMIVPRLIEYKNIERFQEINKHKVAIETKEKTYYTYVFDTESFVKDAKLLRAAYINANTKRRK